MSDAPIQDNIDANGGRYVGDEVMRFHKLPPLETKVAMAISTLETYFYSLDLSIKDQMNLNRAVVLLQRLAERYIPKGK